jgi:hypothetical protein
MINSHYEIWIEAEQWDKSEWDTDNDNTDVVVEFDNGTRWGASFFTYKNISKLIDENRKTGECLNGKYFWSSDMLLIDVVSRERIEEVIKHLIYENKFEFIFKKYND